MRKWTEAELEADDSIPKPQATVAKPKAEKTKKSSVTALQATIELARCGRKEVPPKLSRSWTRTPNCGNTSGT